LSRKRWSCPDFNLSAILIRRSAMADGKAVIEPVREIDMNPGVYPS
jgi:hypothetical protein